MPRFNLVRPCKHCPFRTDETAIRFRGRERAEEIEEHAYRRGFPCHESADLVEYLDHNGDESDGYEFGHNTQHCAGHSIMRILAGDPVWPGMGNDEDLGERLAQQLDLDSPVFKSEEDFYKANEGEPYAQTG